jgi:hypothetical protein
MRLVSCLLWDCSEAPPLQVPAWDREALGRRGVTDELLRDLLARGYLASRPQAPAEQGVVPLFVLTPQGAAAIRRWSQAGRRKRALGGGRRRRGRRPKPYWDDVRGELSYGGAVVLRFKRREGLQRLLVVTFDRACWQELVRNPLPPHPGVDRSEELRQLTHDLNRRQDPLRLRFGGRKEGDLVHWEAAEGPG